MAVKEAAPRSRRINHPSLDQRDGREEKAAREVARRAQKNLAKAHTRDSVQALSKQDYKEFVKAVRSGRLEAVEGV
jgi:hypothetical protein